MTVTKKPESTALIPWSLPQSPEEFIRSEVEKHANEIARRSLEAAKYEACNLTSRHLVQILPPLTGQYAVGCTHFAIERPQTEQLVGDHRIEMEIYAPTRANTGNKLLINPKLMPGHEEINGGHFTQWQLQELHTYSQDQIEPVGKWPILIFSNGMAAHHTEYRHLLEQLASHGYLVLNLNHASSSSSVFDTAPPGVNPFDNVDLNKLAAMQADNIQFVIEELRYGSLKNLGQSDQIILAGHSLGGAASILATRNDPTIKGCMDLDGLLLGPEETLTSRPPAPVLLFTTPGLEAIEKVEKNWNKFSQHSNVERRSIDVDHNDFSVFYMISWVLGDPVNLCALKAHSVSTAAMVQFMHSVVTK